MNFLTRYSRSQIIISLYHKIIINKSTYHTNIQTENESAYNFNSVLIDFLTVG